MNPAAGIAAPPPLIVAEQLAKRFGDRPVVRDIDFAIAAGQCFGFLGPNGAGKTTTLRMLLGLSPPSGGRLEVFGEPMPAAGRSVRARMGVVPQADNLDPDFTVVENLITYGRYFGLTEATLRPRIRDLLDFVELGDRAGARIDTLSGGMKRRLTIARALINDPELVILDEPTTGLDPQVRHLIWARLRELLARGKTLILTTHYMEEAERLCDDLVIMDRGRILERGAPRALVREHVPGDVVEVRHPPAGLAESLAEDRAIELETVGESLYCYTREAHALVDRLEARGGVTYLHRPASLEDVFLRLTGRELHE
ncbi:MAG: ATP-binding cassette domain-containing protein [Gammaproteobacteria bacterium]|nr:ATP-binding cassette domain-containing protein [Gammaproteobacteria bacterium]